jgi:uncharacterized protein YndB with AHSA1/START domain
MTVDPRALSETQREVGRRRIAAGDARTARIRRCYDAPIEDVWDACTDPERIARWFLPVTGDLRAGGTFSLEGNAHGEIVRCVPPRLLRLTWAYGDRPIDEVELRLTPGERGVTILEIEHASVTEQVEVDGRLLDGIVGDPDAGPWGVGIGWELPLTFGLPAYLRGELPDAPAVHWFAFTPEVVEFARRSGAAWAAIVAAESRAK